MNAAAIFETLFLIFLLGNFAIILFLYFRQRCFLLAHRDTVPHEFSRLVSLSDHQKMTGRFLRLNGMRLIRQCALLILVFLFTLDGATLLFSQLSDKLFGNGVLASTATVFLVAVSFWLVNLVLSPSAAFQDSQNRAASFRWWAAIVFLSFVTLIFWYYTGSGWWFWSWLACAIISYCAYRFLPSVEPMAQPLTNEALKDRLDQFLHHIDFVNRGIFVSEASKDNIGHGVRVTGFGRNKQIVIAKSVLDKLMPSEVEALVALEVCRYRSGKGFKVIALPLLLSFIFFLVLSLVSKESWFLQGLGATDLSAVNHGTVLVLFTLALYVFLFPLSPLKNLFFRNIENRAEETSVRLVDWTSVISALVEASSGNAGDIILAPAYSLFYSKDPDAIDKIIHVQKMAPRHTRQRDSWLPSADPEEPERKN